MGIGFRELLIILLIALVLFGAKKLKSVGSDLGAAVKGFKKAMSEGEDEQNKQLSDMTGNGSRRRAIIFFASASSAADMVSKSMRCSTSREEKVSRASSSRRCSCSCTWVFFWSNSASVRRWLCSCSGFACCGWEGGCCGFCAAAGAASATIKAAIVRRHSTDIRSPRGRSRKKSVSYSARTIYHRLKKAPTVQWPPAWTRVH